MADIRKNPYVNPYRPGAGLMPTYIAGRDEDINNIEVEERNDFISQIASCSQAFLRKVSTKEEFKNLIQKPLDAIKSLVVSFDPNDNTFSLSMQERAIHLW